MRTGNPALSVRAFQNVPRAYGMEAMTLDGTVNKTGFLLLLVLLGAGITWYLSFSPRGPSPLVQPLIVLGIIGGLVLALVTVFKKQWAGVTAPLYAAVEGLALGGISAFFEMQYPGIVVQAVALTFGVAFAMLAVYRARIIRVTQSFRLGVAAATGGIALVYLVTLVLRLFGIHVPYLHGSGVFGIGFSLFVVVVAALNLVMDFDFIKQGSDAGLPKYMEWYGAFGLVVTLVWLYLEILRLLAKLQRRD